MCNTAKQSKKFCNLNTNISYLIIDLHKLWPEIMVFIWFSAINICNFVVQGITNEIYVRFIIIVLHLILALRIKVHIYICLLISLASVFWQFSCMIVQQISIYFLLIKGLIDIDSIFSDLSISICFCTMRIFEKLHALMPDKNYLWGVSSKRGN